MLGHYTTGPHLGCEMLILVSVSGIYVKLYQFEGVADNQFVAAMSASL